MLNDAPSSLSGTATHSSRIEHVSGRHSETACSPARRDQQPPVSSVHQAGRRALPALYLSFKSACDCILSGILWFCCRP